MYWVAGGFIYRRVDSTVHRLDARVKLLLTSELVALSLLSFTVIELAISLGSTLSIAVMAGTMKRMGRTLLFSAGFSATIFIIDILVGYTVIEAVVYSMRFIAIVGSTSIFFLTTSPDELEQVMRWFRLPRDLIFAYVTAVRFVPVLMLDAMQIMDAQKSRGLEVEKGNILKRIKNFSPVLIPLVVNAVVRSGELAEAMEVRAYGAVKKPTMLYDFIMKKSDNATALLSIILMIPTLYYFLFLV
ncbi:MAG: energy-coupling factor transporter transmembrane protein EcfT [Thaumarchaeota archaeon]|nr:energy-coupling factor transporter transmembrane protein EcfT [Nitrososphaerota archaeon]